MKVFISQPMRGLSDEEILETREAIKSEVREKYSEVEFLDSFFTDVDGNAVFFLAKSIEVMSKADLAVFGKGWDNARGCRIEEAVATEYGIEKYFSLV